MSPMRTACHTLIVAATLSAAPAVFPAVSAAFAQGVLDDWSAIAPPGDKPVAKRVSLDPATTALLVLDLATQTCAPARHCPDMLPQVSALLSHARARHWTVIYTLGGASKDADILPEIARHEDEAVFTGGPDKYIGTGLEAELKKHGIKTVVTVGSAAEGAVLETAASSAFHGYDVVLPADGMASEFRYAQQYVIWDLTHAPRVADRTTLSASALIE